MAAQSRIVPIRVQPEDLERARAAAARAALGLSAYLRALMLAGVRAQLGGAQAPRLPRRRAGHPAVEDSHE